MISRKQFNEGKFEKVTIKRQHPIITFLKRNRNTAYSVSEIVAVVKMNENTVRGMLRKFVMRKIVEHKIPYYIIK